MTAITLRTRLFQRWFRLSRSLTLGVRGVVTNEDGQVLLIRHTYVEGWYFPGGGVEKAEPCQTALERELLEEVGVVVQSSPRLIGVYSNHRNFPNDHVLLYAIENWQQGTATSKGEIAEMKFFAPTDIPHDTTRGTRQRVEELFLGADSTEEW